MVIWYHTTMNDGMTHRDRLGNKFTGSYLLRMKRMLMKKHSQTIVTKILQKRIRMGLIPADSFAVLFGVERNIKTARNRLSCNNPLKNRIYARDRNKCVKCGSTRNICISPIKPIKTHPHLSIDPNNLQAICRVCKAIPLRGKKYKKKRYTQF